VLKSIIFHVTANQEYEYLGEDRVLRELKENIALYVFQTKIQDEYIAETIIDKGSYATVR
jgi:calcium-dependent protein kinase